MQIIYAKPYEEVKSICHQIKEGNFETVRPLLENDPVRFTDDKVLLIPIPSRSGIAQTNRMLCTIISRNAICTNTPAILDCLICTPHEPLYALKKKGVDIRHIDLNVEVNLNSTHNLRHYLGQGYKPVLVDNVIDTGHTARECLKAIHPAAILTIGDTGNWKELETND